MSKDLRFWFSEDNEICIFTNFKLQTRLGIIALATTTQDKFADIKFVKTHGSNYLKK